MVWWSKTNHNESHVIMKYEPLCESFLIASSGDGTVEEDEEEVRRNGRCNQKFGTTPHQSSFFVYLDKLVDKC